MTLEVNCMFSHTKQALPQTNITARGAARENRLNKNSDCWNTEAKIRKKEGTLPDHGKAELPCNFRKNGKIIIFSDFSVLPASPVATTLLHHAKN
jgi:hypothetical protein